MVSSGLIHHMETPEIRRRNLWAIAHPNGYSDQGVKSLANRTEKTEQRIRHLIAKDPNTKTFKNIGGRAAREFEKYLNLEKGWLDHPHPNLWADFTELENERVPAEFFHSAPPQSNAVLEADVESWDSSTPLQKDEVDLLYYSEVSLAAGSGILCENERPTKKLRFSVETLKKAGVDIPHAICVKVSGISMLPVLPHGSTIGIDTAKTQVTDGDMYALCHKDTLRVKILYKMPGGGIRLRSFNRDEFPDEHIENLEAEEVRIIGRVFWYSVLC